jgi:succinate dehydrogenase / fumarate reductase cytochrome b subunit
MSKTERPLSPHISIYRWPITMLLSILHRITGMALAFGLLALAYWLVAVASGGEAYERAVTLLTSLPGKLLLIAWSFAFFLHLGNGVRHLVWDTGHGLEKSQANASAWFVLMFALAATAIYWVLL